jgi:hypothetical protein
MRTRTRQTRYVSNIIRRVVSAYVTRDDTRLYLHQPIPSVLSMLATPFALLGAFHYILFLALFVHG